MREREREARENKIEQKRARGEERASERGFATSRARKDAAASITHANARGGIAGARPCAYKAAGGDRYQFLPVVGFASATTRRRTDVAASDNDLVSDDSRAS